MEENPDGSRAYLKIDRVRVADQILEDLRVRILRGELPHGSRFPPDRDLAARYGVSVATVREAVRALASQGLVRVRHGSGSIVTVRTETLIAVSLASAIQLEASSVTDVMDILGVVNSHAAGLAARHATDEELASLREAAERLASIEDLDRAMQDLRSFLRLLSGLCGNPVLAAICSFLGQLQVELAMELSQRQMLPLREVAGALHNDRILVVEALEARDPERAEQATRAYHDHALELLTSSPGTQQIRLSDPSYTRLISSLMSTKLVSLTR
ncbi:FadR/GntR family transcriptional regulator [Streptomyces sp. NBC_00038]|uniref:FadR/GntR family transcriptional regulator n=1 Tax=Streptomyces sp. NBC_00038 TaxID=2903615 RepID=UPI002251C8AA|nr:GntR family transcriptional regulator [Streptomyces sp. NBC_00038]MCX5554633.1 GntR family transcriptional regulator [Streptomyces sp. NBC_00038]